MTDRTTAIGVEIDAAPRRSAVSWGAVLAGALVAIAVTLALLVLGSGLGLTLVSPWWEANAGATTIAVSTIIWLVIMQWASSGIGGYLTGRLRNRWASVNSDEVFFRDTAHGLLMWAVATIFIAGMASHSLMGVFSAGTQAAGQAVGGAMGAAAEAADPTAYFVDTLYRPVATGAAAEPAAAATPSATSTAQPGSGMPAVTPGTTPAVTPSASSPSGPTASAPAADGSELRTETLRIVARGMTGDTFPEADRAYLVQRVAAETGMSPEEADARVTEVLQGLTDAKAAAQSAAEEARKAAVALAVVAFVSLLVGAFIGSVAAALGGSHRDDQPEGVILR